MWDFVLCWDFHQVAAWLEPNAETALLVLSHGNLFGLNVQQVFTCRMASIHVSSPRHWCRLLPPHDFSEPSWPCCNMQELFAHTQEWEILTRHTGGLTLMTGAKWAKLPVSQDTKTSFNLIVPLYECVWDQTNTMSVVKHKSVGLRRALQQVRWPPMYSVNRTNFRHHTFNFAKTVTLQGKHPAIARCFPSCSGCYDENGMRIGLGWIK